MLEYTLDDAEALLLKNQETAVKSLAQVEEDLGFLRDQTTTLEVSILSTRITVWFVFPSSLSRVCGIMGVDWF